MQRVYRPPPKLCATQSTKASRRKKGKNNGHDDNAKETVRFVWENGIEMPKGRKKLLLMLSVTAAHHPTQAYQSLHLYHCSFYAKASLRRSCPLILESFGFLCVCDADSSFCYFQTRISFRNTICIFESCMPPC